MESNTPTPYQRNRRAGRITPAPQEEQPAVVQAPAASTQPAAPVPLAYSAGLAQAHGRVTPAKPHEPATAPMQSVPQQGPATVRQNTQAYGQPIPPRMPQQTPAPRAYPQTAMQRAYSAPPVQRPTATRTQGPATPRQPDRQPSVSAYRSTPQPVHKAAPAKMPSWLTTVLCIMLVAVMGLAAATALMHAWLKTSADKREAAHNAILYNYHLTEQDNGALRVTWQDLIEHYSAEYNLNPAFVTAIIRNESSFRTDAVSSVGARGLMQMMPSTAEWVAGKLGEPYDFDRLFEAETSIRYGCWYLNYLSELFSGDTVLVCAAYHAGQGEVWGWLGDPAISPDGVTVAIDRIPISNTKTYAGRVTQAYGIYQTLLYPQPSADQHGAGAADALPSAGR